MQKMFNLQHLWFAALLTYCVQVSAQNPNFSCKVQLLDVSFSNLAFPNGIAKDDGSGYFTAPHWTPSDNKPVAYISGRKVRIKARFKLSCQPSGTMYAKGVNLDGYDLPPVALTYTGTEWVYEGESLRAFPTYYVNAFEPFKISWQMSMDANSSFQEVGASTNPLYVLYSKPYLLSSEGPIQPFYTCVKIGCTYATGQSLEGNIVDNIYKVFTNQCVERAERTGCMSYWGDISKISAPRPIPPTFFNTSGLLANGDARCNAWAKFFIDMTRIQGIHGDPNIKKEGAQLFQVEWTASHSLENSDITQIEADADRVQYALGSRSTNPNISDYSAGFFVNNWGIQNRTRTFVNCFVGQSPNQFISDPGVDLIGLDAQNNTNPWSYFEFHIIVRYNNKYYDPSYGTTICNTLKEWQDRSVAGFGSQVLVQLLDNSRLPKFWVKKVNDASAYILGSPVNY